MTSLKPPQPSPALIAAAGLLSLAAAMGLGRFAFTPMLPVMLRAGQLDIGWGGWLASANYAGYLLGALSAARVPIGARTLAMVALALTAASTAAMAWPGGVPLWLLLRFAVGVGSAWVFVASSVWCLAALTRANRPELAGVVYSGVGAGIAMAGLYCLAASVAGMAPASLWLQIGAGVLASGVAVGAVLMRLAPAPPAQPDNGAIASSPARSTVPLVLCYGVFGFGYILPATFLPVLARTVVDDPRVFGLAWPLFGATAAVSTLLAARWMRRASRLRVWAASQLLMGLGVLLPTLWLHGAGIALAAVLVGGTFMVITMAGVQEIRARAPADATRQVARMTAAFAIGQTAGPALSALLVRQVGDRGLNLAQQVGATALLLTALWLWRIAHESAVATGKEMSHENH